MQIRSQEDISEKIKSFSEQLNKFNLAKKEIDREIKETKQHFKEEGVAISMVNKAIAEIKKELKESETDRVEIDFIKSKLYDDSKFMANMTALLAK